MTEHPQKGADGICQGLGSECQAVAVAKDKTDPRTNKLMEEVLGRENLIQALKRIEANKGAPGVDGMTVDELPDYLEREWPRIRNELLEATYHP